MKQKKLLLFIIVCYAISWGCWLPILDNIESSPFDSAPSVLLLFFIGAYGPTLTGILLAAFFDGKNGLKEMKSRLRLKKKETKWTLLSLGIGPILYGLAVFGYLMFNGQVGEVNYGLLPWLPIVFIVPIIFGPLAEEFGWRGFVLPLLNPKLQPIRASIIVGFIWALWHAPLFWAKSGTAISGFEVTIPLVALFFIAVIGSSFIYTWVFNNTVGNISIAILIHLSMNSSGTIRSMLFPNMGLEDSLYFYKSYAVVLWCFVLLGYLISQYKGKTNPAFQEIERG